MLEVRAGVRRGYDPSPVLVLSPPRLDAAPRTASTSRPSPYRAGGIHSWADLPADLLRLVFLDLHTQAAGGHALRDAARLWLAVAGICRSWRTVALAEVGAMHRVAAQGWSLSRTENAERPPPPPTPPTPGPGLCLKSCPTLPEQHSPQCSNIRSACRSASM